MKKREPDPGLHDALTQLQRAHVVLIPSGKKLHTWSPGVRVPGTLRRVVYAHRSEVLRLIELSEISTCPTPELHRASWTWSLGRFCCDDCARLKKHIS